MEHAYLNQVGTENFAAYSRLIHIGVFWVKTVMAIRKRLFMVFIANLAQDQHDGEVKLADTYLDKYFPMLI